MVLHQLVGLEHVGPDLVPPGNVLLLAHQLAELLFLLLFPQFIEPRPQHLHGHVLVLELRALVLALDNDVRGQVGDAHGGVRLVHVLAPGARGAVGIDAQLLLVDDDIDVLFHLGIDVDRGKGRVPALVRVKGRDAHQAVHAGLGLRPAVGIVARNREGDGFYARFFAVLVVEDLRCIADLLGPAQIHAHEHLGPVLGLGAARAGMDGDDGVGQILFSHKERRHFGRGNVLPDGAELALQLSPHGLAALFRGEFGHGAEIIQAPHERGHVLERTVDNGLFLQDGICLALIVPETRGLHEAGKFG